MAWAKGKYKSCGTGGFWRMLATRPTNNVRRDFKIHACAMALAFGVSALGDATPPAHSYTSGFSAAMKIGEGLYEALPEKFGNQIFAQPVALQPQDMPVISPVLTTDESKAEREVSISAGFIDLMNHVAHAKAIDKIQPGFFDAYIRNLSRMTGEPYVLPDMVDARYWTDDVMDEQISYFNQMMSMLVAINLSHHYLGHYSKYAAKLANVENQAAPINGLITPDEWMISVKAGVHNSLDCALATEGVRALFEAIDKMPERPAWTMYIVPKFADLKALNKELDHWEYDFFHGKLKDM
jgi:hypothetical protein